VTTAYPLRAAADAVTVLDRVAAQTGVANLGLLCDLYDLAVNGDAPGQGW
jgi:hydroxypyruvate isomerase